MEYLFYTRLLLFYLFLLQSQSQLAEPCYYAAKCFEALCLYE